MVYFLDVYYNMPVPILAAKGAMMVARSPAARRMAMRGARAGARRAARDPRMRQMAGRQMARAAQSQRGQQMMRYARSPQGQQMMRNVARGYQNERRRPRVEMRSMAKGGKVRKTGLVYLHKGERVVPVNKVKKVEKGLRKLGVNMRLPNSNTTVKVPIKMLSTTQLRNLARMGGKVMKTGPHRVSKGQRVIPRAKVSNVNKILRKK